MYTIFWNNMLLLSLTTSFILFGVSLAFMLYEAGGDIWSYDWGDSVFADRLFVGGFISLFITFLIAFTIM
jgi:hypothetical protein